LFNLLASTPGNEKYFGTDAGGSKGFFDLPSASGTTDLGVTTRTATAFTLTSSSGADVVVPEASNTEAGLFNAADKTLMATLQTTQSAEKFFGTDAAGTKGYYNFVPPFTFLTDAQIQALTSVTAIEGTMYVSTDSNLRGFYDPAMDGGNGGIHLR